MADKGTRDKGNGEERGGEGRGETKRSLDEPSRLHTVSGVEAEQSVGASLPSEEKNLAKRHLQKMDAV